MFVECTVISTSCELQIEKQLSSVRNTATLIDNKMLRIMKNMRILILKIKMELNFLYKRHFSKHIAF